MAKIRVVDVELINGEADFDLRPETVFEYRPEGLAGQYYYDSSPIRSQAQVNPGEEIYDVTLYHDSEEKLSGLGDDVVSLSEQKHYARIIIIDYA